MSGTQAQTPSSMKLGLHAYSLLLAAALRDIPQVGQSTLSASALLDKAAKLKCTAVQLARRNLAESEWEDMVTLIRLRSQAEELGLTLHLSTGWLNGEHLAAMVRYASTLGAPQVTVGIANLKGNVQRRQQTLEGLLSELDGAITTAERYKVTLAFENGRHMAAMDLEAFVQAVGSEYVGICFDTGNPLTVPENPAESAARLAPYCKSIHLKNWQVYRTADGVALVNCPVGEGVIELSEVLRKFREVPDLPVFLQTGAERLMVPALSDAFLQEYPRITARALASLLRCGALVYHEEEMRFPYEKNTAKPNILKWEEERLERSLKQALKLMGADNLELQLGEIATSAPAEPLILTAFAPRPKAPARGKTKSKGKERTIRLSEDPMLPE